MTRGTSKAHIALAALEGIALQVVNVVEAMQADGGIDLKEIRVDGGASVNNLLMQIQSDLLDVPLVRPMQTESTALGAACLAGLGVGLWANRDDLANVWKEDTRFTPDMPPVERESHLKRWSQAVERAKDWESFTN
jgi:glycerol kinase